MSGYCTYTVYLPYEDDYRAVPCAQPRVGEVNGPGVQVILCKPHYRKVEAAMKAKRGCPEADCAIHNPLQVLTLDEAEQPKLEMAATAGEDAGDP